MRARDLFDIIVLARANQPFAHQFADQRIGAMALRNAAHRDVAVGDHADQPVTFGHRD